jgi:hypothetical protein
MHDDGSGYPPEPWSLRGQMHLSVWLWPSRRAPVRPAAAAGGAVSVLRRQIVGTAWVSYEPGSVLQYRELLSATLVRVGGRPTPTITDIWVDSAASRDGGRALWGIPKEMAEFRPFNTDAAWDATVVDEKGTRIASGTVARGVRLPGRWPIRFGIAQERDGAILRTPVRGTARIRLGWAYWRVAPDGPLGYLHGRRPAFSVTLADFRLTFGRRR